MPKNPKQTGTRAAHIASELLRGKRTPAKVKTVAASDLAQARGQGRGANRAVKRAAARKGKRS